MRCAMNRLGWWLIRLSQPRGEPLVSRDWNAGKYGWVLDANGAAESTFHAITPSDLRSGEITAARIRNRMTRGDR